MKPEARTTWGEMLRRLAPLLPSGLFDRLRASAYPAALSPGAGKAFSTDLRQTIREIASLYHTLTNFLPRYLLDLSPTPSQPHGELVEGSFIFADVTGFTALTGELSKRGTEGREEMNRLMSDLFGALLDPLLSSGGDLLIFAGDAALAHFPAHPGGQDARWATRTALRMVNAIADFSHIRTPYGDFSLTMSAGVERGHAFAAVVGTRKRMELLISGGPVQGAMRAEGEAEPGQVFVGPGIRPLLDAEEFITRGGVVDGVRDGTLDDYEVIPPTRRRSRAFTVISHRVPDLIEHLQPALDQMEELVPFISPALLAQLARRELVSQHPPVAVQFVNVMGLEDIALGPAGPDQATAVLQRYFVRAQEIVAQREGSVNKLDPCAHGCFLLNPFGAPTHHEGIPRLAASAALELARALERVNREFDLDPPLLQRTGMTYERIFSGEFGYRHRREHVVAGPAVNLAARLMSKADPGQIILDPIAWEAVREDFLAQPLPPVPLKGISKAIPRFALQKLRRGQGTHLTDYPLVDRQEELALLEEHLAQAIAGRGRALALVGEAGIGKSHLVAALADSALSQEMNVLITRCRPFAKNTPYFAWKNLVSQYFELDQDTPATTRRQQLKKHLAQFDLAPSLPAFADMLGLPAVDLASRVAHKRQAATSPSKAGAGLFTALQKQIEQQTKPATGWATLAERAAKAETLRAQDAGPSIWTTLRQRASIPQALHTLLEHLARQQPTLLIVEDVQWADAESRKILCELLTAVPGWPLVLLLTTRPESGWWAGDQLSLPPLSDASSRELAALALRATRLEPELAAWLRVRAGGNPLFILSYCRELRNTNALVVDPASGEARQSGPLPALPLSLQEILLAQANRLDREAKRAIQRGAVIGDAFPTWLLARTCRETQAERLNAALDQAARHGIITPPPPSETHSFDSQSLHDAIYTTLSHAQRREWHEQTGDCLAQADKAIRYERLEQIAHHYSRSGNPRKAARFTRLAGDKARAHQADEDALAFYAQTLAASNGEDVATEQRLAHEGSGDVHALRGEREKSVSAYQAALRGASPQGERRLGAKLAVLAPLDGAADPEALEKARQALPASNPLHPWLGAALVWLHAGRGETQTATALCRGLKVGEPVNSLLQQALQSLERGESLPPYADFFALFAHSCLLLPPEDER